MSRLVLVRHSAPEMLVGVPAREWHLSAEGRRRCGPLSERLARYQPSVLASSVEPKAVETAELVAARFGLPVTRAEGLHEHERDRVTSLDQATFQAQIAAFFAHPEELVLGKETASQALARFRAGLERVLRAHPDGDALVVAHGTVMTLYVAEALGIEPYPFWRRLAMPDVVELPRLANARV